VILLLRALARLVAFALLLALALACLTAAVFSIGSGAEGLSLPALADLLRLPTLEQTVGRFLAGVEGGELRGEALAGGALAVLVAVLLLVGALRRPAEGLLVLADGDQGRLAARRRPLGQAVAALAESAAGVAGARVKVKPKRRGRGGVIEVSALHSRRADPAEVDRRVTEALGSLTDEDRSLRVRTLPETGGPGTRVE
jgi:hypothetical protein